MTCRMGAGMGLQSVWRPFCGVLAILVLAVCWHVRSPAAAQEAGPPDGEDVVAVSADGGKVFGTAYFDDLPEDAPLILLFHQARSNGRGEYGPLIGWLNGLGFRVIAWDQRSGGSLYGSSNRTVAARGGGTGYCRAYPDLEAALAFARAHYHPRKLFVWGSSYSGGLVFKLAARHPDEIDGVIAFSPAFAVCGTDRDWRKVEGLPILVVWPDSEAGGRYVPDIIAGLKAKGAGVIIVRRGRHGSSTLVDSRTGHDMSRYRQAVAAALRVMARQP